MNNPTTYSRTQIILHWVIVLLVLFQLVLHEGVQQAFQDRLHGVEVPLVNPHVVAGILVLLLVAWRLWLRLTRGTPALPETESSIFKILALATHWLFYALLIIMPASGIALWFFHLAPAGVTHNLARWVLMALILIHFAAAMMHHFVFRTNVLMRMLGRA
ncbi:MAG: cytochrome b/b6 domain-containing protein [Hyphomicrobiaceae bacterium]|nr:cytochrome b/b6 domain-containing protein [Hyphomicrobiaceae bacterium]